jgi:hypothetical protein
LYAITASLATRLLGNLVAALGEVLSGAKDISDGIDPEIRRASVETHGCPVAGPLPVFRPGAQPCLNGIPRDVATRCEEMTIVFHVLVVVRPLECVPIKFVAPVDVARVRAIDDEHSASEIRFRRFNKQVVVVRQKAERVAEPAKTLDSSREMPEKPLIIPLVVKERVSPVSAGGHMVKPARYFVARPMSHAVTVDSESMQAGCNFVATWLRKCNRNLA